jgi:arylsulfatase A-like enzyme
VGKWHLGDAAFAPETHGFDVNIGGTHWGAPPTFFAPYRGAFGQEREFRYVPHLEFSKPGEYLTDRLTDEALRVIDYAGEKPFFLYLAHHAPHTPIEAPATSTEYFAGRITPKHRQRNPAYAAMVKSLDESVGRIVERLDRARIAERTLIVFTSDNGGYIGEHRGLRVAENAPLRSGKGSLYEGGIRVPLIMSGPGVPAGAVSREPVVTMDLYRTILEIIGKPVAEDSAAAQDGRSLVPLLKSPEARLRREDLYFHYPHYYSTTSPVSAVRSGDWKLLEYHETGRKELYNLRDDPAEARDLHDRRTEIADRLYGRLQSWRTAVDAQMPTENPQFKP